jgi:hypothetical protein
MDMIGLPGNDSFHLARSFQTYPCEDFNLKIFDIDSETNIF